MTEQKRVLVTGAGGFIGQPPCDLSKRKRFLGAGCGILNILNSRMPMRMN